MPDTHSESMSTHLVEEIEAMVVHLSGSGIAIPSSALGLLARIEAGDMPTVVELGQAHAALAEAAAPALPRTLALLSEHRKRGGEGPLRDTFSLPLTYRFIVISGVALIMNLILSALGADELVPNPDLPWAERPLVHAILVRTYIVGQAALGAAFNILWTANTYVTRGTYDPRHDATYLIRFVMGIISGVLLAGIGGEQLTTEQLNSFPLGLLALVGGFSASLLHRVLQRLVGAVESVLAGDGRDAITQAQEQGRLKLTAAVQGERLKLQARLQQLRSAGERDPAAAKALLDELLAGLDASAAASPASPRDLAGPSFDTASSTLLEPPATPRSPTLASDGAAMPKPADAPAPADTPKPADTPAPADTPKPADAPAPADTPKPAVEPPADSRPPSDATSWQRRKPEP